MTSLHRRQRLLARPTGSGRSCRRSHTVRETSGGRSSPFPPAVVVATSRKSLYYVPNFVKLPGVKAFVGLRGIHECRHIFFPKNKLGSRSNDIGETENLSLSPRFSLSCTRRFLFCRAPIITPLLASAFLHRCAAASFSRSVVKSDA